MLGAEAITNFMLQQGIERIFVYPGGTIAPILDAAQRRGIDIFCARHEQGAGYAALASARLTERPQVVMVTSGPGVTNVITVAGDAYFDSYPLIILTGQVGTGDLKTNLPLRQRGFQEIDANALLRPVTKAQFLVTNPDDVEHVFEEAWRIARDGRPGPVHIDLPMDVQRGEVLKPNTPTDKVVQATNESEIAEIQTAADWLCSAARPVIIAGQGVLLANAQFELRKLVEHCRIPVSHSLLGLGAVPTESQLSLGFHGHTGNQYAGRAIHEADLVLVIGSRLDVRQTGSCFDKFVPNGRIIRIDVDREEINFARVKSDLIICADAKKALVQLNKAIEQRVLPEWSSWREQIQKWREHYALKYNANSGLKPQYIIEKLNQIACEGQVICVAGVGSHQHWAARHFDFDFPQRIWLTSGGHGAMGFDLPVAIGAQMERPEATVLCVVGDGSLQMNIQELATIAEKNLPVKIIVLDNGRLGLVSQFQKLNWGSDPACGCKWNPDFAAIARAYGIRGFTVKTSADADTVLPTVLCDRQAVLVHCCIDPHEDISPMLLGGQTMDRMWTYAE